MEKDEAIIENAPEKDKNVFDPREEEIFELKDKISNFERERDKYKKDYDDVTGSEKYKFADGIENFLNIHPEERAAIHRILNRTAESESGELPDPIQADIAMLKNKLSRIEVEKAKEAENGVYQKAAREFMDNYAQLANRYPVMNHPVAKNAIQQRFMHMRPDETLLTIVKGVIKDMSIPIPGTMDTATIQKLVSSPKIATGSQSNLKEVPKFKNSREALHYAAKERGWEK
jgi:hypothetical protein